MSKEPRKTGRHREADDTRFDLGETLARSRVCYSLRRRVGKIDRKRRVQNARESTHDDGSLTLSLGADVLDIIVLACSLSQASSDNDKQRQLICTMSAWWCREKSPVVASR